MDSEIQDRTEWVDKGLDGLRKEIDGHFARHTEALGGLRTEIEQMTRRRPSLLARVGPISPSSWKTGTSTSGPSTPPSGLGWTDGRIADLQSHVRTESTGVSAVVAGIKARIKEYDKEASNRRSNLLWLLFICTLVALLLGPSIIAGAITLLA